MTAITAVLLLLCAHAIGLPVAAVVIRWAKSLEEPGAG